jgi:hypothetical protein
MKPHLITILLLCSGPLALHAQSESATTFTVNASSSTDIITQINALTAACGANCVIHIPAGKFKTQSSVPITLHPGQSLIGEGEQLTSISGNVPKMIVWHAGGTADFFPPAGKIANMSIHCGPATTECIDTGDLVQAHLESLVVDGADAGDCISITNFNHWFERSSFINVTVGSPGGNAGLCLVGIHLRTPAGGTNSYGYASYLGIQSNQSGGAALAVAGVVSASFLSVTGEGPGASVHVLKGGSVRGCGSLVSELGPAIVDEPANDTHTALDLTDCGFSAAVTPFADYMGEGPANFTPRILNHSSTGEVNAGLFFSGNANRTGGPAMLFTRGGHFAVGWKDLYNQIGIFHPVWSIDASGNATQTGALTASNLKSGENVVAPTPAPVFSTSAQSNILMLNGSASFSIAAGSAGQPMTLIFCQDARGGSSIAAPANVRGLGAIGTAPSRCSSQSFIYSANRNAWIATAPMVTNE